MNKQAATNLVKKTFESPYNRDSFLSLAKNLFHSFEPATFVYRGNYIPDAYKKQIKTLAWCTGAAQDFIELAASAEVDAYITGEASERTVHFAREAGIHFYACGHHATERDGILSLGEHLAQKFNLTHKFIDIPNPV